MHVWRGVSTRPSTLVLRSRFRMRPTCHRLNRQLDAGQSRCLHPSSGNGFRGEIEFNDNTFDGRDTYAANLVSCPNGDNKYVYYEKVVTSLQRVSRGTRRKTTVLESA